MAFDVTCPECGWRYTVPAMLQNITIVGAAMNVVAPCPKCGHKCDVTGGGDGTFSVVGRRLVKVAETLARSSASELVGLEARIAEVAERQDRAEAVALARSMGWSPPEESRSRLSTGNEALDFIIKLQIVIALLLKGGEWTVETVQQLLAQVMGG